MKIFVYAVLIGFVGMLSLQIIGVSQASAAQVTQGWKKGLESVSSAKTGLPETDAKNVVISVVRWLLSLVFWLAVLAFVASGLIFIVSFGNSSIHTIAKDWLTFAVIGLIVSVLGYVIIISISNMLIGKNIGSSRGGGSGGSIIFDSGGVWGEATIPVGDNGSITVNNDGAFGDISLPW
jgi:hypothetical protein